MGEDMLSASLVDDCEPDYCDPVQRLGLIERLESYADAELVYTRQLTARGVVRALQFVEEYTEAQRLLTIINKIADDPDVTIRADLLENIPSISHFCHDNSSLFANAAESPISDFILPFVLKYVKDGHNQIRKASQTAILFMLEQRILSPEESAAKLVPVVVNFAQCQSSDDIRADAANLMCKMAPVLGSELTENLLLEPFLRLCTDAVFHVRKVCAINIGDLCYILGQQRTEESILGKFYALCEDSIWGVRKACCECFAQVSSVCTPAVRRTELSQLFINLIYDQSRWVRMAAFETLGSFIATFADSAVTGLYLTDEGVLNFRPSNSLPNLNLKIYDIQSIPAENSAVSDENGCADVPSVKSNGLEASPSNNCSTNCGSPNESLALYNSETDEVLLPENSYKNLENDQVHAREEFLSMAEKLYEENHEPTLPPNGDSVSDDDTKKSLPKSVVILNGETVNNGGESLCTLHNLSSEDSKVDDECKPSLEMFSSEVDAVDSISSVQCGSLELLCDNDDELDINSAKMSPEPLVADVEVDNNPSETLSVCHVNDVEIAMNPEEISAVTYITDVQVDMVPADISTVMYVTDVDVVLNPTETSTISVELDAQSDMNKMHDLVECTASTLVLESSDGHIERALETEMVSEKTADSLMRVSADLEVMKVCDEDICSEQTNESKMHHDGGMEQPLDNCVTFVVPVAEQLGEKSQNEDVDVVVSNESNALSLTSFDNTESTVSVEKTTTDDSDNQVAEEQHLSHNNVPAGDNDETFNFVETAIPTMLNVEDSFDQFISEEECNGKGASLTCLENLDESTESGEDSADEDDQSVVPRDLLNQYLGMMDPSCALTVDNEVTRHCAYSLPAVAFTLGRRNWPSLRNLYRALCSDVQWKVRRTLASSMHELAMIVGEEVTVSDLVPVFDQFLGDLDEVRIGVLKHLADFIKMLPDDVRHSYLAKLTELLRVDNSHNWRFREELANQLCLVVDLYNPSEVRMYICPMAFALADDKVAAVRSAAVHLLCSILKRLMDTDLRIVYINELTSQFASSSHYIGRQMFIQLCDSALESCAIEGRGFSDSFLQPLLSLHVDPVPNVRIALARTIARHADRLERLCRECVINPDLLDGVVNLLKHDVDRDVRMLIDQAKLFTVLC